MEKIKHLLAIISIALSFAAYADGNVDIIVTNEGESMKVYNLDYSPADYCYYTTSPESDDLKRIKKSEVLIIKLANGNKIDPNADEEATATAKSSAQDIENPGRHEPVTFNATTNDFMVVEKKTKKNQPSLEKFILAGDNEHPYVHFKLISEDQKTLAVAMYAKGTDEEKVAKKNKVDCIIPEYVKVGENIYTVVEIDDEALMECKFTNIQLPSTLKTIGYKAFVYCSSLKSIIIPEGVEKIGKKAFRLSGSQDFTELHIPKSVKEIGDGAFFWVGPDVSYNKHYKGYLSCIPDWVTTGNCTRFNIDEEAVEAYLNRNRQ